MDWDESSFGLKASRENLAPWRGFDFSAVQFGVGGLGEFTVSADPYVERFIVAWVDRELGVVAVV